MLATMKDDVILLGTSLALQKGQRVWIDFASNQPSGGWFARPVDGNWKRDSVSLYSQGLGISDDASILLNADDLIFDIG